MSYIEYDFPTKTMSEQFRQKDTKIWKFNSLKEYIIPKH